MNQQPVNGAPARDQNGFDPRTSNPTNDLPPSELNAGISADEIALYDRQIRLWGLDAQERIRKANILLIYIRGLGNEIAKNLVLAGIGSLTVIDHHPVVSDDLGAQFLLCEEDIGKNRAVAAVPQLRLLNPRVIVTADTSNIGEKSAAYFSQFDIVIATDQISHHLCLFNTATRVSHKKFYAAGVHGFYGWIFSDLIKHDYIIEREKGNRDTALGPETRTRRIIDVTTKKEGIKNMEYVTKREFYSTWLLSSDDSRLPEEYTKSKRRLRAVTPLLSCLRALWHYQVRHNGLFPGNNATDISEFTTLATEKHKKLGLPAESLKAEFLRNFLQNIGTEIAPVTAIIGAQLAQDVINVLGNKQQPIQNFVFFNGETMEAPTYPLHPEGDLGEELLPLSNNVAQQTAHGTVVPVGGVLMPTADGGALELAPSTTPLSMTHFTTTPQDRVECEQYTGVYRIRKGSTTWKP